MSSFRIVPGYALDDSTFVDSDVPEADHAEWDSGTDYTTGDRVIVIGTTHAIFQAVADNGPSHGGAVDPATDTDEGHWLNVGATNRWKVADGYIGDPATQANSAYWEFTFSGVVDSVFLRDVSASTVQIEAWDAMGALVYDETTSLVDNAGAVDWYSYLFGPIIRLSAYGVSDVPPYPGGRVRVTLTDTGATVSLGQLIIGQKVELGDVLNGLPRGIRDFSEKSTDQFGRRSITERDFLQKMRVQFAFEGRLQDWITDQLADVRARPTIFAADTAYGDNTRVVYGFFNEFQTELVVGMTSEGYIDLEGIT